MAAPFPSGPTNTAAISSQAAATRRAYTSFRRWRFNHIFLADRRQPSNLTHGPGKEWRNHPKSPSEPRYLETKRSYALGDFLCQSLRRRSYRLGEHRLPLGKGGTIL